MFNFLDKQSFYFFPLYFSEKKRGGGGGHLPPFLPSSSLPPGFATGIERAKLLKRETNTSCFESESEL